MQVQRYGKNPATGRVEHFYEERGPVRVPYTRGAPVVPAAAKSSGAYGRKVATVAP